jgi:hypothetical protein
MRELQSFRSMRRIDARRKNASALRLRFSQSLASLRALDDPTAGKYHKPFGVIGAFDDFSFDVRPDFRERLLEFRPLIATVGKELLQEGIHPEQGRQQQDAAFAGAGSECRRNERWRGATGPAYLREYGASCP